MPAERENNKYAEFLKEQGICVIEVEDVCWYDDGGVMKPAYLPHCCPPVTREQALGVLGKAGRPLVWWDSQFGRVEKSEWWCVLKRGDWAIEKILDKKRRWMIRQGRKNFSVRPMSFDEVLEGCAEVAKLATLRYSLPTAIETQETFEKRVSAARKIPGVLEYIGCFQGDKLVSFAESCIQKNAVWLTSIRHNPAYLNQYSGYGLMDGVLRYYLNERKTTYVLDGWRSIHHRTEIQEHLIKVFGFTKEYAIFNVVYSDCFALAVKMAYPLRRIVWALLNKWTNRTLDKVGAVFRAEYIRRACAKLQSDSQNV
jgi:hypothetical protein